ncbi:uncharacterized protein LOC123404243 [Hordeum vulgare subsp. vulgare]|uniref:uncharacterized protein LOC123404243 n=1 Tax=Hordeum vulgare subsp. vulgare TaxID=112509 RepID=UPI00162C0895|nr:uncharacterized protein LOC123404243 [Hordeum vulgare subsp. vulgare]XP_044954093.1 uncharacterized protein LOC123404243 [Hordeum vulgare subsp. vulgare]XP_044954094.1 uncharacterized protein LOC123404243 [Hordeum vulgare subsp. vulgare]XP_044954095.1 uncharacterized protein LOC123404243 [Hordeum vulgare subsp. vulgare]
MWGTVVLWLMTMSQMWLQILAQPLLFLYQRNTKSMSNRNSGGGAGKELGDQQWRFHQRGDQLGLGGDSTSDGEGAASTLNTSCCTLAGDFPNSCTGVGGSGEGAAAARGTLGGRGGKEPLWVVRIDDGVGRRVPRLHRRNYMSEIIGEGDGDGEEDKIEGAGGVIRRDGKARRMGGACRRRHVGLYDSCRRWTELVPAGGEAKRKKK